MSANSFGNRFKITTFGESHGVALGVVIDGCPAQVCFEQSLLQQWMQRRRPGSSAIVSSRNEADEVEVLSGVFAGKTLGTPIAMIVRNLDARSEDYQAIKSNPRSGHADDVWQKKFAHTDWRGGGRASGRETVARVMAGAVAQMLANHLQPALKVVGQATQIGELELPQDEDKLEAMLTQAKAEGKSYGGIAKIKIENIAPGLGQPVFNKLKTDLAAAFMSIGASCGLEFGAGFQAAKAEGSVFHKNLANYGGIRGGITTGEPVEVQVVFKPTSSVLDVAKQGRHDPCIVPRAIPVLEAMTWLVLADHLLWQKTDQLD